MSRRIKPLSEAKVTKILMVLKKRASKINGEATIPAKS